MLADFAARLRYGDVPQRHREHCKNLIAVNRLEDCGSVRELLTLLRAAPRTRAMAAAE